MGHLKRISTLGLALLPALALITLILAMASAACQPKPGAGGGTTFGKIVSCGTSAVAEHSAQLLPGVNSCLSGTVDITGCLLGVAAGVAEVGVDVVACLVRHEGAAASAASQANRDDTVDARRAARAHEFIEKNGIRFAD